MLYFAHPHAAGPGIPWKTRNLGVIRAACEARREDAAWISDIENALLEKAARHTSSP
jgi:hypothetical protein